MKNSALMGRSDEKFVNGRSIVAIHKEGRLSKKYESDSWQSLPEVIELLWHHGKECYAVWIRKSRPNSSNS